MNLLQVQGELIFFGILTYHRACRSCGAEILLLQVQLQMPMYIFTMEIGLIDQLHE